ncbi:MAG: hypothetical protein OEZ65_13370 [Gemmatimonadota bacterium]|nr:hypothetical protein [Gemmatimonadota bacterium]
MAHDPPFRATGLPEGARRSAFSAEERRHEAPATLPSSPSCPFCEGTETEIMNAFGSHASVAQYWCRSCRSPFEVMKWRGAGGKP